MRDLLGVFQAHRRRFGPQGKSGAHDRCIGAVRVPEEGLGCLPDLPRDAQLHTRPASQRRQGYLARKPLGCSADSLVESRVATALGSQSAQVLGLILCASGLQRRGQGGAQLLLEVGLELAGYEPARRIHNRPSSRRNSGPLYAVRRIALPYYLPSRDPHKRGGLAHNFRENHA